MHRSHCGWQSENNVRTCHQDQMLSVTLPIWGLKAASSRKAASTQPSSITYSCMHAYVSTCGRCWWSLDTEVVQQHLSPNEFCFKHYMKKTAGSSAAFRGGWSPRIPFIHKYMQTQTWNKGWIMKYQTIEPLQTTAWLGIIKTDYTVILMHEFFSAASKLSICSFSSYLSLQCL